MTIKFGVRDATVYDKDRKAMEKKLTQRISRYFSDEEVEAYVKISGVRNGFKAEITLPYYGYQLRAESGIDESLMAAFDSAVDVLEKRMARHKDKIVSRKTRRPGQEPKVVPDYSSDSDSEEFQIVRIKKYEFKPMTTQDAILNMETLGHDFYVFMNAEDNKICTVYKRRDGGYGMVVPG
ncbi:MAG: ribosome-associated translation inhibitor RaiA [Clostridia bacterium]|nr:ribosome-associated translation inhibitor RaiA [Clostridia bacterium]